MNHDRPHPAWHASQRQRLLPLLRRRLPWLALVLTLCALVASAALDGEPSPIDRMLQNAALRWVRPPASEAIVIVAIDDRSLETIGRWPWRRALHAELLRQISAGKPRCIGMDLLFSENEAFGPATEDALLARRMRESGCVVLPMALSAGGAGSAFQKELLPVPVLADAARDVGQAHLAIDGGGSAEGIYLQEGLPGRPWPHFVQALKNAGEGRPRSAAARSGAGPLTSPPAPRWQRRDKRLTLFPAPSPPYLTVSYADVLLGKVSPETFRDRYVLVGATAASLADVFAIAAPSPQGLVPGVEIFAAALQNMLEGQHFADATPWQNLAFNLVPLAVVLLGLLWLGPVGVFALIVAMLLAGAGLLMAQPWLGIRFAPAGGAVGLLLVYPLWSLMQLTAAYRFLRRGTRELNTVLDGLSMPGNAAPSGDFLNREIDATAAAVRRVRDLHRFVRDGMDHLPDATLVLDRNGCVFMANQAAGRHWKREAWRLAGQDAHGLLADLCSRDGGQPLIPPGALRSEHPAPISGEAEDATQRTVLLRCVPFLDADNVHAGWTVALVDITRMRRAQHQRDEALRFISHDIREPHSSILSVLHLARAQPAQLPRDLLLARIERHARSGLSLADGFVSLARAEAQPFRAELLDLVALGTQAIDNLWAEARRREVVVRLDTVLDEAPCVGDRNLLGRAIGNVLSNAIKYSPQGAEVRCTLVEQHATWTLSVADRGPGIPEALQSQLFQPFHRLHRESHPEVQGVGLGLMLVRTAMQRHGGRVQIESADNAGCTVTLVLPKPVARRSRGLNIPRLEA